MSGGCGRVHTICIAVWHSDRSVHAPNGSVWPATTTPRQSHPGMSGEAPAACEAKYSVLRAGNVDQPECYPDPATTRSQRLPVSTLPGKAAASSSAPQEASQIASWWLGTMSKAPTVAGHATRTCWRRGQLAAQRENAIRAGPPWVHTKRTAAFNVSFQARPDDHGRPIINFGLLGYRLIDPTAVGSRVSYLQHCEPIPRTRPDCRTVDVF